MEKVESDSRNNALLEASRLVAEAQKTTAGAVAASQLRTSLISGLLVLAGVVSTPIVNYMNKNRELSIEQTRIALALLSGDTKESSIPARRFAIDLLMKSTSVKISSADQKNWILSGTLPMDVKNVNPWLFSNVFGMPGVNQYSNPYQKMAPPILPQPPEIPPKGKQTLP